MFCTQHNKSFFTLVIETFLIMFTRMLLGAHYLSDVSAGAIIGVLSSIACAAIQLRISQKKYMKS